MPTLVLLAGRLFLALYLVSFLSLSGLVYVERWSVGAHVTPEMWAEHKQLVRMGYTNHHHGYDGATDHDAHAGTSSTAKPALPFMPVWSSLPQFPLAIEWTPYLAMNSAMLIVVLVVVRFIFVGANDASKDYYPPIPHRPPVVIR